MERIEWTDSGMMFGLAWMSRDELADKIGSWDGKVVSVGHVVHEDELCVVLANSVDQENNNVAGCMLIYKGCINKRVTLAAWDD